MTCPWGELLQNKEVLDSLYNSIPSLQSVTVRSIHLDSYGPTLTLRLDLPEFPQNAPEEWREAGLNSFQCQLQFLAVGNVSLIGWRPPMVADVEISALGGGRIAVNVTSDCTILSFESADSILAGHMSAFRSVDGSDAGRHHFISKLDSRLFNRLPPLSEKTFYEHI